MAFMMPVMKNEFDIYNGTRSRKISECSNTISCRSRKVSECRLESPSSSTSPGTDLIESPQRNSTFHRTSSRTTSNSSFMTSPTKSQISCPPKSAANSGSQGSLNKFHIKLVDKLRKSLHK